MRPAATSQDWARAHSVTTFYLLAFAISWLGYVPVLAGSRGAAFFESPFWRLALVLPGCGPAVAVLITRQWYRGKSASQSLLKVLPAPPGPGWYVLALLSPAALLLCAQGVSRLLPEHPSTLAPSSASGLLSVALVSLAANPWEEVGWRGFALKTLQRRYSAVTATLIVGVLWGLWHIPLFLWPGSGMSTYPFWAWFVAIVAESYVLTWLYNSSGQCLWIAIVFHIAFNLFSAILGIDSFLSLALVNSAAAAALVWRFGEGLGLGRQRGADAGEAGSRAGRLDGRA